MDTEERAARIEASALAAVAYEKGKLPRPKFFTDEALDKEIRADLKTKPRRKVDDWFHPHTFGRWCRRREILKLLWQHTGEKITRKAPAPALALIFEAGHACHRHYRNVLIPQRMIGCWRCGKCGEPHGFHIFIDETGWQEMIVDDLIPRPEQCKECGYTEKMSFRLSYEVFMEFIEPPIVIEGYRIKGHTDGIMMHREKTMVCELKSQDPHLWGERRGPDIGHIMQGTCYSWGLKETYGLDIELTAAIYINKSTYRPKTYIFKADETKKNWIKGEIDATNAVVDANKGQIKTEEDLRILRGEAEFNSQSTRECAHENVSQAKGCALREICFNLKTRKRKS